MIPAGQRPHQMTAYTIGSGTADSTGQIPEVATILKAFRGKIETQVGASREAFQVFRVNATASHVVTAPYFAGLTATCYLMFGTRRFNLAGPPVNRGELNIELLIPVVESPTP